MEIYQPHNTMRDGSVKCLLGSNQPVIPPKGPR